MPASNQAARLGGAMLGKRLSALIVGAVFTAVGIADCVRAQAQPQLRVGFQDAEPGIVHNSNQPGGRDIEMWDAITKAAGFRSTYVIMENQSKVLAALDEGKIDVAGTALTRTPETEAKYHLTDALFMTAEAVIVPKSDTKAYRGLEDIRGLTFATLKGSAYANYLKQVGITAFKEYDNTPAVMNAVSAGQTNAAIFSGIISGYLLKQGKYPDLRVVTTYQPALARPIMAGFPKTATETYDKVNASIRRLNADGTIKRVLANYGQ